MSKITIHGIEPVSYTHLDVYKRQSRSGMDVLWMSPLHLRSLWAARAAFTCKLTGLSYGTDDSLSLIHI